MTFSIVGVDPAASQMGVAIATARPSVGGRCTFAVPGVAVVATQAIVSPGLAVDLLDSMAAGEDLQSAAASALSGDAAPDVRQLLAMDAHGRVFAHTGDAVSGWAGACTGPAASCAGNLLVGPEVLDEMLRAFHSASGTLARRLMAALRAGDDAGGDRRGRESAALCVVGDQPWPVIDVRVDHDAAPVDALTRVLDRWDASWGVYERTGVFPPADPPGAPLEDRSAGSSESNASRLDSRSVAPIVRRPDSTGC